MVRVFLGIFMLLAIGGAAVTTFVYLNHQREQQFTQDAAKAFVNLDPILIPTSKEGVVETRTYNVVVETRAGEPHRRVIEQQKRLRDKYLLYLSALSIRAGPENIDNIDYVKVQLRAAASDVVGPNVVYDVLFRNILVRPPV